MNRPAANVGLSHLRVKPMPKTMASTNVAITEPKRTTGLSQMLLAPVASAVSI